MAPTRLQVGEHEVKMDEIKLNRPKAKMVKRDRTTYVFAGSEAHGKAQVGPKKAQVGPKMAQDRVKMAKMGGD